MNYILSIDWVLQWIKRHAFFSVFLLLLLTISRNGFSIYRTTWINFQENSNSGPFKFQDLQWTSLFDIKSLFQFVGDSFGPHVYFIFYTLILLFFVLLIIKQISEFTPHFKYKFLLVLTYLPVSTIILQRFGTYDAFCLLLAISGIITKNWIYACLSGFVFASINPEAACVSGLGVLLMISLGLKIEQDVNFDFPKRSLLNASSQICFGSLFALIHFFEGRSAAEAILFVDSKKALVQFLSSGSLLIYAMFGSFWFVLYKFSLLLKVNIRKRLLFVIMLVGSISLIASDGTRNSSLGLTSLSTLIIFSTLGIQTVKQLSRSELCFMFLMPALNVANFNVVLPFYQIIYFFDYARPYLITN
jgi:hypothetical protein